MKSNEGYNKTKHNKIEEIKFAGPLAQWRVGERVCFEVVFRRGMFTSPPPSQGPFFPRSVSSKSP